MHSSRSQGSSSYLSHLNTSSDLNTSLHTVTCDRSFSSLFDSSSTKGSQHKFSNSAESNKSFNTSYSHQELPSFCNDSSIEDDDGVFLQISNLDQYYDENSLKNYLMNQLKPITPILMLSIETPSIAKVKVPSIQVSF